MCVASMVSILAQQELEAAELIVADFGLADSEWAEYSHHIQQFFPL